MAKQFFTKSITLNAGEKKTIRFKDNPEFDDYAPYKNIFIINDEGLAPIHVAPNSSEQDIRVPKGTIRELKDMTLNHVIFENKGSVSTTFYYEVNNFNTELDMLKILANVDLEARRY